MALMLHIDTAVQTASVCLANDNVVLDLAVNPSERESAAWLHQAIKELLDKNQKELGQLEAVAVSAGPGSYTGLRVGMATAKGLCFALSVPLIAVPTLQMMAASVPGTAGGLLCPLIDARRMEVFTALYNEKLEEIVPAKNLILEQGFFNDWLQNNSVLFFGNGSQKAKTVLAHPNAKFADVTATAAHMVDLAANRFAQRQFSDLAYAEPFYGKEFYSTMST